MADKIISELKHDSEIFRNKHIHELFNEVPDRYQHMHVKSNGIVFDYSKQRITDDILNKLIDLAECRGLSDWVNRLFSCENVNHTEGRSAMHWALRMPKLINQNDKNYAVNVLVHEQLDKMEALVEKVRTGQFRGATGEKITNVVNIGVGGSDLGPLMVCSALTALQDTSQIRVRFASTMDGSQLSQIVKKLRPESTLFIISSKSFTTIDTLSNALTAKQWLMEALGDKPEVLSCHFIGVSTRSDKMTEWGISPDLQLNLWDWVGGRYSLWSAIGLPVAIALGMDKFRELLSGAYDVDQHFVQTPWKSNIPVLLALIGIWNTNFLGIKTHAILPYDGRLEYLTSYLQQLEMESNGKSVRRDNSHVEYSTCPIIWGEVGPNAQHAFYQLLHQGTITVSTDFIIAKHRYNYHKTISEQPVHFDALQQQHRLAIANCLAQSRLLALGNYAVQSPENTEHIPVYRQYHGNKPSSTIILPQLSPYYLGALIAIYEHKVFVQSVMWDINPFDQWGVEMGKTIANTILPYLSGEPLQDNLDDSTLGLLQEFLS